ncbi:hypothetical protein L210DRAFT_3633082, partial [Boletus edulis BED1]
MPESDIPLNHCAMKINTGDEHDTRLGLHHQSYLVLGKSAIPFIKAGIPTAIPEKVALFGSTSITLVEDRFTQFLDAVAHGEFNRDHFNCRWISTFPPPSQNQFGFFLPPCRVPLIFLTSTLVSRVKGTDVIEGGYNFAHTSSASTSTRTAVGCMLYCQRHPDLNLPTPTIYAYSCTHGSEFMAMEYLDGDNAFHEDKNTFPDDRRNGSGWLR